MMTFNIQLLLFACTFMQAVFAYENPYNRTFELVGDQVCEIYAVVEHPKVWESYVTENKIVTFENCDETVTVDNAPTHIRTTITHKVTVDPCPPETCTDEKCHSETKVVTETITPCKDHRCTTKTITYTITKTRTDEGKSTQKPHGVCRDKHCEDGQCCSEQYECGYGPIFCGKGCRPEKGECHPDHPVNPHGSCKDGKHCENHACCCKNFECGYGPDFCGNGCHPDLGKCDNKPEKDRCLYGEKCKYGECCSVDYYCGKGPNFCGEGCHPDLGKCDEPREERCLDGNRCKHGNCCSADYFCGKGPEFCGTGCHPNLGKCDDITCGAYAPVPNCPIIPGTDNFQYCCGDKNICGLGPKYCAPPKCQEEYGYCYPTPPSPTATESAPTASPTACGPYNLCPFIPGTNDYRYCCGENSTCGLGDEYCAASRCQPDYGYCYPTTTTDAIPSATATSTTCGAGAYNPDCPVIAGSDNFQYCCGADNTCGLGPEFCAPPECQLEYGYCYPTPTETIPVPTATSTGGPVQCGSEAPTPECPVIPGTDNFRYCCGADNTCGLGPEYCDRPPCQPEYGYCYPTPTDTISPPTATPTGPVQCGAYAPNSNCPVIPGTDDFQYCCGADNTCGLGPEYCDRPPCQPEYGYCYPTPTETFTAPIPTATSEVECGPDAPNPNCPKIPGTDNFQSCCGKDFTCGLGPQFCAPPGCKPDYGYCYPDRTSSVVEPSTTEPVATATPSGPVTCGILKLCPFIPGTYGYRYCCGPESTCGLGPLFCGKGCQPDYGYCPPDTTSSITPEATSTPLDATSTPPDVSSRPSGVPSVTIIPGITSTPLDLSSIPLDVSSILSNVPSLTIIPGTTSTPLDVSSAPPDVSSGPPNVSSAPPDVSSMLPKVTSTPLDVSSAPLDVSSTPPEASSTLPEVSSTPPDISSLTSIPEMTSTSAEVPSATPSTPVIRCGEYLEECPSFNTGATMTPGCCSSEGICGIGIGFCDAGCQPLYGICDPIPCGPGNSCPLFPIPGGSAQGCCNGGFCGVGDVFCGPGCQPQYGGTCTCGQSIGSCPSVTLPFFGPTQQCCNNGQCGFGAAFCSGGCDDNYGRCYPELCGPIFGTCNNPADCCGSNDRCGSGGGFCGAGCKLAYGAPCDPPPPVCGYGIGDCPTEGDCCNADGQCSTDNCNSPDCRPFGAQCQTCGELVGDCPTTGDCCNAQGVCGAYNCDSPDCRPYGAQCQTCGPLIGNCPNAEDCCNSAGVCGAGESFCGSGCQPFGSPCQECGPNIGNCANPDDCCSADGFCSSVSCGPGCQNEYGYPCDNCPFVPPPGSFLPVKILPFLVKRFCCLWYSVVTVQTCGDIEGQFGLGVGILEGLNPGGIPGNCVLPIGVSVCVKGIPPFFNIQGRNTIPTLGNVDNALLEGRVTDQQITGFELSSIFPPPYTVRLFYAPLLSTSFASNVVLIPQFLRAHTGGFGGVNNPPTVRLDFGSPGSSFLLDCTIVDGSGLISCSANGGTYDQFAICDATGQPNRRNLCLGDGSNVGNYDASVQLYAVAAT